jgi:hypothetical protein
MVTFFPLSEFTTQLRAAHLCALCPSTDSSHYTVQGKKVNLSRYTPWRRLGWEEVQLLLILNLGTRWGWVVSVTPRPRFTPGERTPGNHWTGGWVGRRAGLDAEARGNILCPCRGSNPDRPARSQTLYWHGVGTLEKFSLMVTHLIKKFAASMESKVLLPWPQKFAIGNYIEPVESSPHTHSNTNKICCH